MAITKALVDGIPVTYAQAGKRDNSAVLFVHGLGGSYRFAQECLFPYFNNEFFCLAPSLPGFGGSEPFPRGRHTMERYAQFLIDFMDQLNVERAHVVGFSLGGAPSLICAAEHPERVAKLCLQGTPYWGKEFPKQDRRLFLTAAKISLAIPGGPRVLLKIIRTWLSSNNPEGDNAKQEAVPEDNDRQQRREIVPRAWIESVADIMTADLRDRALSLKVPTLLVDGAESRWYPEATTQRLAALISGSTYRFAGGYGHLFPFVAPKLFSDIVIQFLKK